MNGVIHVKNILMKTIEHMEVTKMKKILLLALSAAMLLSIVSCADPTIEQPKVDTNAPAADVGQLTEQPEPIEKINVTYELVKPFGTYKDPNATELSPEEVEALLKDENAIIPDCVLPASIGYESMAAFHSAIQEHSFDHVSVDSKASTQYATQYYQPTVIPDGYVFKFVTYDNDYYKYIYVTEEIADLPNYYRYYDNSIEIQWINDPSQATTEYLEKVFKCKVNEDGMAYKKNRMYQRIGFIQDNCLIIIQAPLALGDYDMLRTLCEIETVTIFAPDQ